MIYIAYHDAFYVSTGYYFLCKLNFASFPASYFILLSIVHFIIPVFIRFLIFFIK